ncbi:L-asparaginase 2-4 [Cladobotryum mycophilum]|uniref:asparaginase n=1 Tax=Cladobotryum mycophilum TaxID=491253 RepID=A0ABR0SYY4_9HYPO
MPNKGTTAGYSSGTITITDIIDKNPHLKQIANVKGLQLCNIGSPDITSSLLIQMAQQIQADLARPDILGVVVTHGTDTMEETSFFLDTTIKSDKPVVLVGAMRPATALSADGNMNLFQAATLAASSEGKNRGVMVVHNDTILAGRYMIKSHANRIHTFVAGDHGCLGTFENGRSMFSYPPSRPRNWIQFDIKALKADKGLPRVDIIYGHLDTSIDLITSAIQNGANGLVLAGMGAGCWTTAGGKTLTAVVKKKGNFPLVASYRTAFGYVGLDEDIYGLGHIAMGGGFLNPVKCRLLLQLCLAKNLTPDQCRKAFE